MKPKIIYIMGHSRSGSTIFDIMLSNAEDAIGVGELTNLQQLGWKKNEYCSCGDKVLDCSFWKEVKDQLKPKNIISDEEFISSKVKVEIHKDYFLNYVKNKQADDVLTNYLKYNQALLDVIFTSSGKNYIVDSSKKPSRAFFFSLLDVFDVYVLHIVRDPRAVCWSLRKPYKKNIAKGVQNDMPGLPIYKTIKSWIRNSILALEVKKQVKNYKLITYNELIKNPIETLTSIEQFTGLNLGNVKGKVENDEEFSQFHTVAGNRLRMSEKIKLKFDDSWKDNLNIFQKFFIVLVTFPLMKKYGFTIFNK